MSTEADARQTEQIPEWKREEVESLVQLIDSYESVGVVNIAGIPSRQLQNMRRELHGRAELRVSRNTLLTRALESVNDGVEQLVEHIYGQVGLVATDDNPFGLFKQLEASKTPAPINAGEVVPNEVVIPAGDTGIDPGPFVGELQQVGAAARIMEGSIHVTDDSIVASEGDVVSDELAGVLAELEIEPKEVGLDLRGVFSDGVVFGPEELAIDVDEYRTNVQTAAATARTLSIETAYPTTTTAPALLAKASAEAKSLGLYAAIEDESLVPALVQRADAQLRALAAVIDDEEALPEELHGAAAPVAVSEAEPEESTDDEVESEAEAAAEDDDEDEDDGAEGLGAMFG